MRKTSAIVLGKAIAKLTKTLKVGGGSAAPGYYALKLYPQLIEEVIKQIPKNIIITGTNGKTTTARMLAHIAQSSGLKVIRNTTGSNLERGIASTLIHHSSLITHHSYDLGIWEVDEVAFNTVVPKINPDIIIFLNAYRDQLDRYGEVDSVVKKWQQTLRKVNPKTTIILNSDDSNVNGLEMFFKGEVLKFSVADYQIVGENHQPKKNGQKNNLIAKDIKTNKLEEISFYLDGVYLPHTRGVLASHRLNIKLPLSGIYNVYNFLSAFIAGYKLGFSTNQMIKSLKDYSPAFGRMEKFDWGYIALIKNPTGATEVLKTISPLLKPNDRLLVALNDKFADGTDVSWIWDANFELIQNLPRAKSRDYMIYTSGTRALDLTVRLKYAGFNPKKLVVEPDLKKAFKASKDGLKGTLYILTTYTAMLKLQRIFAEMGIKKHYWEENN